MLDGGLRPGEVLCLQLEDVAYGRRRVTIRKRDDHPRGARAKGRRERVVDLHEPRTLDAVSRYVLHERPVEAESPFVFLVGGTGARRCEPLSYQAIARGFARRLDRLGIRTPEKTPHALRHTHATAMWEARDAGAGVAEPSRACLAGVHAHLHPGLGRASSRRLRRRVGRSGVTAAARLALVQPVEVRCEHVDRGHLPGLGLAACRRPAVSGRAGWRCFDEFLERWPRLQDWFAAPLRDRLLDRDGCVRGQHPHGGASVDHAVSELPVAGARRRAGLRRCCSAGTFASPFTDSVHQGGLGVDVGAVRPTRHPADSARLLAEPVPGSQL